ncbi:MAG: alpha/beta fold hydrolase [Candidatus Berkelbacteria bacterium]
MKKVIIVHGWGGNPSGDWFPWLKEKLEANSVEVIVPAMPDTLRPTIDAWVSALADAAGNIDEDTILVGHSIGCQTILRFVEKLPENTKIGGIILVAAWLHLSDETWDEEYTKEIAKPWLETPINFEKIKNHTKNVVCIQSEDDPYVPVADAAIFEEKLVAKIILLKNSGHIAAEDGITDLPEVLKQIYNLTNN